MPLQATSGAASYDAFGGGVAAVPNYIEDVFSTYLYTGNGSTQTITNGIDLAGEGGLVWTKSRTYGDNGGTPGNHVLWDSSVQLPLNSNTTNAALNSNATATSGGVNSFTSTGFVSKAAFSGANYASWTFRKQPKFFDVVTYTGNGTTQNIAHNLGSVPGCIIVKRTDSVGSWTTYHRSLGSTKYLILNSIGAETTSVNVWNNTDPTSTAFTVGPWNSESGATYVAYLFAHNAGGFGLTGTDNVISCGSAATNGSGVATVDLGYEPQWLMVKRTDGNNNWWMGDVMRGMTATGDYQLLTANTSNAEATATNLRVSATGFSLNNAGIASQSFIYIAIRRGPMKVPTTGTSVYSNATANIAYNLNTMPSAGSVSSVDMMLNLSINAAQFNHRIADRLSGGGVLSTPSEGAQTSPYFAFDLMAGVRASVNVSGSTTFSSGFSYFRRAPGFFDEVCYTGTGTSTTQAHNLGAVPELMIVKARNTATTNWSVFSQLTPTTYRYNTLQTNSAGTGGRTYGPGGSPNFEELSAQPTSTVINLASSPEANFSGRTFVAYLFATCPGVSKVGSYTGTGTTQTINCGFTGGARFILIKATSTTGDWYVWDSARGIVAGNDPYLRLNSTAAEVTNTDWVDTAASGFELSNEGGNLANSNGVSYIFLAIS
jgi:hypothetical protein